MRPVMRDEREEIMREAIRAEQEKRPRRILMGKVVRMRETSGLDAENYRVCVWREKPPRWFALWALLIALFVLALTGCASMGDLRDLTRGTRAGNDTTPQATGLLAKSEPPAAPLDVRDDAAAEALYGAKLANPRGK